MGVSAIAPALDGSHADHVSRTVVALRDVRLPRATSRPRADTPRVTALIGAAVAICAAAGSLGAQDTGAGLCDGRVVSGIDIVREEPRLIRRYGTSS